MMASNSTASFYRRCQDYPSSMVVYSTYTAFNVLLLMPLYIFVLAVGFWRWRRRRSGAPPTTHTDVFTFHMIFLEMLGIAGAVFYILSYHSYEALLLLGVYTFCVIYPGQTMFHMAACVERYVAVVHPVTYMRLRDKQGVRIRNVSALAAWLFCLLWVGVTQRSLPDIPTVPFLVYLGVCLLLMLYLSISVLCVLIRPGPGEVGGAREPSNQSKRRAFQMMAAITAVLGVRCVGLLATFSLEKLLRVQQEVGCVLLDSCLFLLVPSSLVLPVLFLHRAGRLTCRRQR